MSESDDWDCDEVVVPEISRKSSGLWNDEDVADDAVEAAPAKQDMPPPAKKKTLTQKLAERKQEEELRKMEKVQLNEESAVDRKMRLHRAELESDLEAARTMFGDSIEPKIEKPLSIEAPLEFKVPSSKAEFDEYLQIVIKKFEPLEVTFFQLQVSANYPAFVEGLMREIVISLSLEDTRKISSSLTAIINEKQKATKDSKKKKSAKVKAAPIGKGFDTTNYQDAGYDEYDDFM